MHLADRIADLLLPAGEPADRRLPGHTEAAVLVPLIEDPVLGPVAVLTERHAGLRKHAGEISFPGGRRDEGEDLLTTALREAEEEVGLSRYDVRVAGRLPAVTTLGSRFQVHPFVGVVEPGPAWVPHEVEVAQVLELSLADLAAARQWRPLLSRGVPVPTVSFEVDGHLVWGATARITDALLRRLAPVLG